MLSRLKTKFPTVVTHPVFLAIPITLLILVLLPPLFTKYKGSIESVDIRDQSQMSKTYYIDLDKDGLSEKIRIYRWQNNSTAIEVFAYNGSIIDQFNIDGYYHFQFDLLHGDYNNNGKEEIYFFTQTDDTLIYINQLEFLSDTNFIENSKLVTGITLHNKKLDSYISQINITDLNSDNYKEILFSINSGYTLQPRNIYAWDVKNDTILESPISYAKLINPMLIDIDNDGELEIISSSGSPGNTHGNREIPYHDNSAWLMIFNHNLEFKYKPIEYKGYGTILKVDIIKNKEKVNFLLVLEFNVIKDKEYGKICLLDNKLQQVQERKLDKKYSKFYQILKPKIKNSELVWLVNSKLNIIEQIDIKLNTIKQFKSPGSFSFFDIDRDENDEILYWNTNHDKLFIARSDFSHPIAYDIPESIGNNYEIWTLRLNGEKAPQLAYQRGNRNYLLNYAENPYYLLRYPFYLLVYIVFALFFYLIQKIQKKRIEQKYAHERELAKLQIQTIRNQTDPHFIFNALNSISSAIYREDKDTAYNFLTDFSSLIRAAIINSDKIQVSLQEEIDFIENYLRLEKLRFKEKFDFKIDIDHQVDKNVNVPRMVLQSYIENAIKHGIMHANHKGLLEITIKNKNNHLDITIDDNGIGREKAKEFSAMSTGKGLLIMHRIYELYYKLHKIKITQTIEDKKDDKGNGIGTRVKIEIPLNETNSL